MAQHFGLWDLARCDMSTCRWIISHCVLYFVSEMNLLSALPVHSQHFLSAPGTRPTEEFLNFDYLLLVSPPKKQSVIFIEK